MKKLIFIAMSVAARIISAGASTANEPIYLEKGMESYSSTYIIGDVNMDGKISVADAVLLQNGLMNEEIEKDIPRGIDLNFDGILDSFDIILMRQLVIHPENAYTQTYNIDIITAENIPSMPEELDECENIITNSGDMNDYLSSFMTDSAEINKYLDKYDVAFFEENNLILMPYIQKFGEGIYSKIAGCMYINHRDFSGILSIAYDDYQQDTGLYPETNTPLLVQISVPKCYSAPDTKHICLYLGESFFSEQLDTVTYTDGEHEIVITQESAWGYDAKLYIKNPDGSFNYVTFFYIDELFTDGVMSCDDYDISFDEDSFTISYNSDTGVWTTESFSYDGEYIK